MNIEDEMRTEIPPKKPKGEIEGENLKNQESDPAEGSVEETSKIDSLKEKKKGLLEKIKDVGKQRKEVKEGEKIYDKENKEKIEKEREEAKEEMDRLFSEMSKNIKYQRDTTMAQHERLVELGKTPEFDLANDAINYLSHLEQETHDSFLKDLDSLVAQVKLWEYNKDGYKVEERHLDPTKKSLKELSGVYEGILRNIKDSKKDLSKFSSELEEKKGKKGKRKSQRAKRKEKEEEEKIAQDAFFGE